MKTTLFLSVSLDGYIADKRGIPDFPNGAWQDWCALVNSADNVIAGRTSYEQLNGDDMASLLNPTHKIVLSTQDIELTNSGWQLANSPSQALELLSQAGIEEAIIGGGRAVACAFMREGLIDYIVVDLQPSLFGEGISVFGEAIPETQLKLIESQSLNQNTLRLRYEVLSRKA
ncbi:MAG TPA: dihydrofolate reductase [Methylophaga aminisulfidivorans]|uniref:Dihydrofolate reductase n=2 Tax=root TaxID=1 RepID=A0A7C2A6W9_9GAMM|nr:dihydrofolate reductase [Methylophaga aminisulfidivorans]